VLTTDFRYIFYQKSNTNAALFVSRVSPPMSSNMVQVLQNPSHSPKPSPGVRSTSLSCTSNRVSPPFARSKPIDLPPCMSSTPACERPTLSDSMRLDRRHGFEPPSSRTVEMGVVAGRRPRGVRGREETVVPISYFKMMYLVLLWNAKTRIPNRDSASTRLPYLHVRMYLNL
jgi:hypothetical protein